MGTIFRDPVRWAASAVGTQARFALSFLALALLMALAVFQAADGGARAAVGLALFLAWMQFLSLYALRALYLRLMAQGRDAA